MPAVSIIIPMYNVQPYIERCLRSLMAQSFGDYQVICVDDGSSDNTLSVAKSIIAGDSRFEFLTQDNAGQSCARNNALKYAMGNFVLFLDADDYYESETLRVLHERVVRDDLDVLFFSARTEYESAKVRALYQDDYLSRANIEGCMTGQELFVRFSDDDSLCVSPTMQMIKRGFLVEHKICFPEGIIHEDNLFTCLVLIYAQRAAFLNVPLYIRVIRMGSTMTSKRTIRNVCGYFKCAFELEVWLRGEGFTSQLDFKKALLHHIAYCYDLAAFEALSIDASILEAQAVSLNYDEELSFRLHVIEHAKETRGIREGYATSTTYRIGCAIMAIPCWIKDRLSR